MSGLSPKEVASAFPWNSPLCQPVDGEQLFTEMPGCLIPWRRWRMCITVAVCRGKHGTCLETCLSTCLNRRTGLTTKPPQKLVAVFSAAVETLSIKTLCQISFCDRAQSFFRKCFTSLQVFSAGCWREYVSFNPGVYLVRYQRAEGLQTLGIFLPKASESMFAWHPGLLVSPSWSHLQCLALSCSQIFFLFFREPQHSQNQQNDLWNGLIVHPLPISISQSRNPNASLSFPGPRRVI